MWHFYAMPTAQACARACRNCAGRNFRIPDQIGIGAAVTRRPLPHHRAYGSVHGGSSRLR